MEIKLNPLLYLLLGDLLVSPFRFLSFPSPEFAFGLGIFLPELNHLWFAFFILICEADEMIRPVFGGFLL